MVTIWRIANGELPVSVIVVSDAPRFAPSVAVVVWTGKHELICACAKAVSRRKGSNCFTFL